MKKISIKLSKIEDIRHFVNNVSKYSVDIDLQSGRYLVDARSLMGIFSLDLLSPVDCIINSEDETVVNKILEDVKEWTV